MHNVFYFILDLFIWNIQYNNHTYHAYSIYRIPFTLSFQRIQFRKNARNVRITEVVVGRRDRCIFSGHKKQSDAKLSHSIPPWWRKLFKMQNTSSTSAEGTIESSQQDSKIVVRSALHLILVFLFCGLHTLTVMKVT